MIVKANLALFAGRLAGIKWEASQYRVVMAIAALAIVALSLGAGHKWD